jgi:xanthine dehydrogenase accessory factor
MLVKNNHMKNIYLQISKIVQPASGLVLATVTGSRGSTPQKPGSSALFGKSGLMSGTVGGGMVENKVSEYAGKCLISGESAFLQFKLDSDVSRKEEPICGGTISILVDANPLNHLKVFKEMETSLAEGVPGVLVTMVKMSKVPQVLINRYWFTGTTRPSLPDHFMKEIEQQVNIILSSSAKSDYREMEIVNPGEEQSSTFFLEPVFLLPRLIIAGAGHIGKALSHLGGMLDFEVTVIDDRHEYANIEKLPDADHIIVKDIGEAIKEIPKDTDTYIVIVTRGHSDDAKALKPCFDSGAGYTGMIGSRSKIAKMREEFIMNKWATEDQWLKIYAPIGLEIGSKTVEEIAVSIAAQLVLVRSGKNK